MNTKYRIANLVNKKKRLLLLLIINIRRNLCINQINYDTRDATKIEWRQQMCVLIILAYTRSLKAFHTWTNTCNVWSISAQLSCSFSYIEIPLLQITNKLLQVSLFSERLIISSLIHIYKKNIIFSSLLLLYKRNVIFFYFVYTTVYLLSYYQNRNWKYVHTTYQK